MTMQADTGSARAARDGGTVPSTRGAHWPGWFRDLPREHGFEPLRIEGRIPDDLRGVLYRNGPAMFGEGASRRGHWFDGDGAVTAVCIAGGRAQGAVRLVQTDALRAERRAGGATRISGYGTRGSSWLRAMWQLHVAGSPSRANTNVALWQGRLLSLYEATGPVELTPELLETRGETDLGGVVVGAFSAHPHTVRARGAAYNFGVRYGRTTELDLYALPERGPAARLGAVPVGLPSLVHDFAATERHLVFLVPPLRLELPRMLLALGTYADNLRWEPAHGTEVVVVPIDRPGEARRFCVDPFYQWHIANAFERGGEIVLDVARYPDFASEHFIRGLYQGRVKTASDSVLARAVLDPVAGRLSWQTLWDRSCEFLTVSPEVAGAPHRYVYAAAHASRESAASGPQDVLARVDTRTGAVHEVSLGEGVYPSEPLFAPRPGARSEDDGYVLTLGYDSARDASLLAVLDAADLRRGPIARAWFDHRIPPAFHGVWTGEV